jgi:hypothetical protein
MGMVVGLVFLGIGILLFLAAPDARTFTIIWMGAVVVAVTYNAINVFFPRGIADRVVETPDLGPARADFDMRLRKIAKLKDDGLISDEEFRRKRAEIMQERW